MEPVGLRLVQNSLKAVNKIFMIFITVKYIKARKHEFIFLLNQLVQKFDILFVTEVISGEAVDKLKQLLLILWDR